MLISVAVATYNGEMFIRNQMDSILSQTYSDLEVVVCDDCSTDGTINILEDYASKDSRIKIFKNDCNLGFKKNFEKAISLCRGEYIALCDQDDVWTQNHIEILCKNIGSNDCVCGNAMLTDAGGNELGVTMRDFIPVHILPENNDVFFSHEVYGNIVQGAACLIRKSLSVRVLPIPDCVKYHDWWIALNACANGGCKYVDEIVLNYRRHASNATKCPKFGFAEAITFFFRDVRDQKKSYQEIDLMLNELKKNGLSQSKAKEVDLALEFFNALLQRNRFLWRIKHYISNYNVIQLSSRKNVLPFLYRLLCLSIKGVKL